MLSGIGAGGVHTSNEPLTEFMCKWFETATFRLIAEFAADVLDQTTKPKQPAPVRWTLQVRLQLKYELVENENSPLNSCRVFE